MKYYYTLWVDTVTYIRQRQKDDTLIFIPLGIFIMAQMMNIYTVIFLFLFIFDLNIHFDSYLVAFLQKIGIHHEKASAALAFGILLLLNYLFLVKGNKTEILKEKYPYHSGKFILWYYGISFLAMMTPLVIILFIQNK